MVGTCFDYASLITHMKTHIYRHTEKERERQRDRDRKTHSKRHRDNMDQNTVKKNFNQFLSALFLLKCDSCSIQTSCECTCKLHESAHIW